MKKQQQQNTNPSAPTSTEIAAQQGRREMGDRKKKGWWGLVILNFLQVHTKYSPAHGKRDVDDHDVMSWAAVSIGIEDSSRTVRYL